MPAQPITLDFYFLAIAEAVDRDFNRILSAYPTLNQSPLGSCALAGNFIFYRPRIYRFTSWI